MATMPSCHLVNFVHAFSVPLTLWMICLILGIPYEDTKFIKEFTDEFARLIDPTHSLERAIRATETVVEGYKYLAAKMDYFVGSSCNNLLSVIANAQVDGKSLSIEERISMAHFVTVADNETTRNGMSSAMYVLASQPDICARLKREPAQSSDTRDAREYTGELNVSIQT